MSSTSNFDNEDLRDMANDINDSNDKSGTKEGKYKATQISEDGKDYTARLIEEYELKTLGDTDEIWYYDEEHGIFRSDGELIIRAIIEADIGMPYLDQNGNWKKGKLKTAQVNEYLNSIRRRTTIDRTAFNPSVEWIATKNCMVNLKTGETADFGPEFMCTTQIPVIYDPNYNISQIADFFRMSEERHHKEQEERGRIMKFLYDIMAPDDVDLFLDFLAYCLWREYRFNFWMLFHGAGFNGKSILLQLVERFLGKENVSGETLDRLLTRDFAVGNLFGKMANIDADISPDVIFSNTGIIKKLTGNDIHIGEFKFKDPFKFVNFAKLIFSCNKIPETEDMTDAFLRRILIINFVQQFFGEKDDPHLVDKICIEEEFSMLFSELLSRLPRILEYGFRKTTSESIAETYDKYTKGSNPVKYFYEKGLAIQIGNKITKLDVYEHFAKFCREHGLAPVSTGSFNRRLADEHNLKYGQFRLNGERVYAWVDIRLVDWNLKEQAEQRDMKDFYFSEAQKEAMR